MRIRHDRSAKRTAGAAIVAHRSRAGQTLRSWALLAAVLAGPGCGPEGGVELVDVAPSSGLDFRYFNGMSGRFLFVETVGGGAAVFDYDGDGDLDVYLTAGSWAGNARADEVWLPPGEDPPRDRLFRNDTIAGSDPRFVDATDSARLKALEYGMGVAVGDYDNDGRPDLYLSNFGPNELWRNRGDGVFEEVSGEAGVRDDRWSTSAAFVDLDGDDWLDLYVVNYTDFRIANHRACPGKSGLADYCGPQAYEPVTDRLFRNRGDGGFEDVTARAGLLAAPGAGLGVVSGDFDGDGLPDVYVGNDGMRNALWHNLGDWRFEDVALGSGTAVNRSGEVEASMGIESGDVDNDGDEDLFMTHLRGETNTLYLNLGGGLFDDRSSVSGLGAASVGSTGFGTALFDLDNDGWLDAYVANGAVKVIAEQRDREERFPLALPNQLFRNEEGRFTELAGMPSLESERVSRGVAAGDVDNDGRTDLVVSNNSGPAELLMNRHAGGRWLGVRALVPAGRPALGTAVRSPGATFGLRRIRRDGSYLSSRDPRLRLGLGRENRPVTIDLEWRSGRRTRLLGLRPGEYYTVRDGT